MDAKQFPLRSVEEPNSSKVLRGSHDGFVESIMKNAALLRRRIRDPALTLERLQVGGRSRAGRGPVLHARAGGRDAHRRAA